MYFGGFRIVPGISIKEMTLAGRPDLCKEMPLAGGLEPVAGLPSDRVRRAAQTMRGELVNLFP